MIFSPVSATSMPLVPSSVPTGDATNNMVPASVIDQIKLTPKAIGVLVEDAEFVIGLSEFEQQKYCLTSMGFDENEAKHVLDIVIQAQKQGVNLSAYRSLVAIGEEVASRLQAYTITNKHKAQTNPDILLALSRNLTSETLESARSEYAALELKLDSLVEYGTDEATSREVGKSTLRLLSDMLWSLFNRGTGYNAEKLTSAKEAAISGSMSVTPTTSVSSSRTPADSILPNLSPSPSPNTLTIEVLGQQQFFAAGCIIRNPTITVIGIYPYPPNYNYLIMYSCYKALNALPTVRGVLCDATDHIIKELVIDEPAVWPYYPVVSFNSNSGGFILGIARSTLPTFLLNMYDLQGNLTKSFAFDSEPTMNGTQASLSITMTGDYYGVQYLVSCVKNNKLYTITNPGAFFPNSASTTKQITSEALLGGGQAIVGTGGGGYSYYLAYYSVGEQQLYTQYFSCSDGSCNSMTLGGKYSYPCNSTYRIIANGDPRSSSGIVLTSDAMIWDGSVYDTRGYTFSSLTTYHDNDYNQFVVFDPSGVDARIYGRTYSDGKLIKIFLGNFYLPISDNNTAQPFADSQLLSDELVMLTRVEGCNGETTEECYIAAYYLSQTRLIGYYPFIGNAIDQSTYGNDALVKGANLCSDYLARPDHAYCFNGIDNYLDIANAPSLNALQLGITLVAWVKPTMLSGVQTILSRWDDYNVTGSAYNFGFVDNKLSFTLSTGDNSAPTIQFLSNSVLPNNIWSQVAVVCCSPIMYINGQKDYSASSGNSIRLSDLNVLLGASYCAGLPCHSFNGTMTQVRIYNNQQSDAAILELYEESGPSPSLGPNPSPSPSTGPNPSPSTHSNPDPGILGLGKSDVIIIGCAVGVTIAALTVVGLFACRKSGNGQQARSPEHPWRSPLLDRERTVVPTECRR